jgi:hypothetical protein
MSLPAPRSPEDIAKLKRDWKLDPDWDLETTSGFEAHYDELLAFSNEWRADCERRELRELQAEANKFGGTIQDAIDLRVAKRSEEAAMQGAIRALRHLYTNLGGKPYEDMDADFNDVAHNIAMIAEARVAQKATIAQAGRD